MSSAIPLFPLWALVACYKVTFTFLLLYNTFQFSFPGVKWLGIRTDHPSDSGAEVKEALPLGVSPLCSHRACIRFEL
jgi:hypothetical protein